MDKKLKVGVVISSPMYLRTWYDTGILHSLANRTNLVVIVQAGDNVLANSLSEFDQRQVTLPLNPVLELTAIVNWVGNLKESKSFRFRYARILLGDKLWIRGSLAKTVKSFTLGLWHFLSTIVMKPHYVILRLSLVRWIVQILVNRYGLKKIRPMSAAVSDLDWLLIPNFVFDRFLDPLIRLCNNLGVKTFLVLDNWDNLTSKLVFSTIPDKVNIVGHDSMQFAKKIHNLEEPVATVIGLPRFEMHRIIREGSPREIQAGNQILYAGGSHPWNEFQHVNKTFSAAQRIFAAKADFEFVYRPHPVHPFKDYSALNSRISIQKMNAKDLAPSGGLPRLTPLYFSDLESASLIIGPATTLVIEALLLGKPVILDAREDGEFRTSPGSLLRNYEHISQLNQLSGLPIARNDLELEKHLIDFSRGELTFARQSDVENLFFLGKDDFGSLLYREMTSSGD